MTRISSRDTPLWRHKDVFRHKIPVMVLYILSQKNYNFDLMQLYRFFPLRIHSLFSAFKTPLILTIYGHMAEIWISLITCNSTPFYPIEMGVSPEIIVFYTENYYQVFTTSFLNFLSNAKFGHHIWCHDSSQDEANTNKEVIYQPTCPPSLVTFDRFYFCLWPRTLCFGRIGGRKSPSNRPP